ncbi:glycosyl hydrolase family 95 catalytic domain-containing protein [Planctomycetes bacterium K23_9]|uniref:Alpha-L-fucosidase n=1 Tax=Stieleria marina TaxID=1930275 RepID=A0A517NUN7_9BACT|nr:hypothetical protein K239x_28300 [Planctomycetes bacterium K23_9]
MHFQSFAHPTILIVILAVSSSPWTAADESNSIPTKTSLPITVPVADHVDWKTTLAQQDMIWDQLPRNWKEAPFLGNGEQGTMMYQIDNRRLRWDVGCSAAHDHRPFEQDDQSEKNVATLNRGRHFIGHLEMQFPAKLTGGTARLGLWNAETTGTLDSLAGNAEWTALVHANAPVMRLGCKATGQLKGMVMAYVPQPATNPRAQRAKTPRIPANPAPVQSKLADGVQTAVHNLHAGGQTAVAWQQRNIDGTQWLWLSVQHSFPDKVAMDKAVSAVRSAVAADQDVWLQTHRDWWHQYYHASFVSTGDPYWDAFYWAQQYKLASATRGKGWILDNQGPWLQPTAWNSIWWNLNAQLSHSGFATANRRDMGSALSYRLDIKRENLARNVAPAYREDSYAIGRNSSGWDLLGRAGQPGTGRPPMDRLIGRECGNLLWALHNVDLEYRYWQDQELRDRVLYPLLVRAVNYYRHFLVEQPDGLLHLPQTYSPEYRLAEDCTYDLDLLRWGSGRLLELAEESRLNQADEPLISAWQDIQKRLVPSHVDKTGRMIGRSLPLSGPHRHWSHLMAIYPLRNLTPDTAEDRELITRSLDHWHSFKAGLAGYSATGGACMAALLSDGDRALEFLGRLKNFLHANTFYSEAGGLPVIETPLHGATAIQEMLLQSWGGRLRIFPAVPDDWSTVQFHQLRGEGAFLVSARREQGSTKWAVIQSQSGGTVAIDPQMPAAQYLTSPDTTVQVSQDGLYQVKTLPGGWVAFYPQGEPLTDFTVTPVPRRGKPFRFGKPTAKQPH